MGEHDGSSSWSDGGLKLSCHPAPRTQVLPGPAEGQGGTGREDLPLCDRQRAAPGSADPPPEG